MANPTRWIFLHGAKAPCVYIVFTRCSYYPNQINNVLAFPGIFRDALDAKAKNITLGM